MSNLKRRQVLEVPQLCGQLAYEVGFNRSNNNGANGTKTTTLLRTVLEIVRQNHDL